MGTLFLEQKNSIPQPLDWGKVNLQVEALLENKKKSFMILIKIDTKE